MGLHFDLPMQQYLDHHGIGSSLLKHILATPADFYAARQKGNGETKQTILGTAVHTAVLEPKEFYQRYALQPQDWGPRNVGIGYKLWNDFKKEHSHKICLNWEDAQYIRTVIMTVVKHSFLQEILKEGRSEVTAFADYKTFSLKARNDLLLPRAIYDVKTTSESLDNIFSLVFKSGWHFQAAQQIRVTNANLSPSEYVNDYGWIIISTATPAVHIKVVKAPPELIKWAYISIYRCSNTLTTMGLVQAF